MVRIVICDDEKEAVTLHEEIIKDSLQSCGIGYEITTYTYSSNLLSDITEDGFFYDLLLLDIEMPDVTGMELAGKIKPFLPNIKVIFITSHMEYAIDAFELSIFRYVPKNDFEKRLKTAVADAAKLIELEAGKEYIIQTAGRMEKMMENECKAVPVITEGELKTTKKDADLHGWGLKSVRTTAERYDGIVETEYGGCRFCTVVTLSYEPVRAEEIYFP